MTRGYERLLGARDSLGLEMIRKAREGSLGIAEKCYKTLKIYGNNRNLGEFSSVIG